jgi:hypothetical protein
MSYVLCGPIASPGDSHGSGEPFRAANDNHNIANRRVPITPDLDFRRRIFAGHRNTLLSRKGSLAVNPSASITVAGTLALEMVGECHFRSA